MVIDKLPIYARFGVREVWRYDGDKFSILRLESGEYVETAESPALPPLTSGALTDLIVKCKSLHSTDWLDAVAARAV